MQNMANKINQQQVIRKVYAEFIKSMALGTEVLCVEVEGGLVE